MKLRLNEAIARSKENGKKVFKKEIAAKLWPDANESARQVAMTSLCNGSTKRISPEQVNIICDMLDCDANFLFGIENE